MKRKARAGAAYLLPPPLRPWQRRGCSSCGGHGRGGGGAGAGGSGGGGNSFYRSFRDGSCSSAINVAFGLYVISRTRHRRCSTRLSMDDTSSAHDHDASDNIGKRLNLPRELPPKGSKPLIDEKTLEDEEDKVAKNEANAIEDLKKSVPSPNLRGVTRLQVVIDIDDTIKSSGGVKALGQNLGGVDTQYRRGECYPGVFQFALELTVNELPVGFEPVPIAVLTARARELKFALALEPDHPVCRKFRFAGMERGYEDWGIGPVLYGSVKEWVFHERKGLRKFHNFQLLHVHNRDSQDSEHCSTRYVYVGDTGELDLAAGEMMLRRYPQEMRAVFLHTVYNEHELGVSAAPPAWKDTRLCGVPIVFFRTYVGAAKKACELQLMDERALRRVAAKAVKELLRIDPDHNSSRWADLMHDIKRAGLVVGKHWLWI